LIPSEVADLINTGNFIAVSVVVKDKPIGILYADNGYTPLNQRQFDRMKSLSIRMAALFDNR